MSVAYAETTFSERYGHWRASRDCVREDAEQVHEHLLQCVWYDQLFNTPELRTLEGHRLRVVSPGWWNRQAGPDFRGAQLEFNGKPFTGDVEIHFVPESWTAHGHHLDPRYQDVVLHVVLDADPPHPRVLTCQGRAIATLVLRPYLARDWDDLRDSVRSPVPSVPRPINEGRCASLLPLQGPAPLQRFLHLAGEWRVLNKARALRERMDQDGPDQALYEHFMYACGFSHFKHHFRSLARHLPYERACQLARQDPLLLETAFLQLAGLLPESLPNGTTAIPHFARLRALRRDHLEGLRSLPLTWTRSGIRPNNQPERRLAGAARFLTRTAATGLTGGLEAIWRQEATPLQRRRMLEELFPGPTGFWAAHCTWTGKQLARPCAPLGPDRVRSIIGNIFVPAGLALARRARDRHREEIVLAFYAALPKESDNQILKVMLPRLLGRHEQLKLDFRTQQGLLQMHQDWCEPNPSCRNCSLYSYLEEPPP
jgi:hypothetical protein